ncbi:hypothetical protein B0J14DRAFT_556879 [Halenospora varia]|nr:hypothetical protein B0J14DRAFT_556879 [Halenospora varia]
MDPQKQSNNSAPSNSSAISSSTINLSNHNRTPKCFGKPGHEARTEQWISKILFVAQFPDHNPDLTKDWLIFRTPASDFEPDTENTHTSSVPWKPEGVLPDQWDGEGIPPTTLAAYAKDAPPWLEWRGLSNTLESTLRIGRLKRRYTTITWRQGRGNGILLFLQRLLSPRKPSRRHRRFSSNSLDTTSGRDFNSYCKIEYSHLP